jgi:hypothetical protein
VQQPNVHNWHMSQFQPPQNEIFRRSFPILCTENWAIRLLRH